MRRDPAGLREFVELCVDILHVAALARPDGATDDNIPIGVHTIDNPMSGEFVFVIVDERGAEGSAVTQGIRR